MLDIRIQTRSVMAKNNTKYIFVTGGVLSGVGKGIASASLGKILKARGFSVNIQKCDPYLNMDAGTLNPGEHGEVFVTDDGAETDLDVGHYERFLDTNLTQSSSLMAGRVFDNVLQAERRGEYLGSTIQIIPHITNEIQKQILEAGKGFGVHIVEIGGTVGDYEGLHFIEAIRQIKYKVGQENVFFVHVVFLPYLETTGEVKSRPAQYSVRELKELGIDPNMIILRSDHLVPEDVVRKISLYSDVPEKAIIPLETAESVYEVPLTLEKASAGSYISKYLGLGSRKPNLKEWEELIVKIKQKKKTVKIGIVAKYLTNLDTYTSIVEALKSAAWANNLNLELVWVNAEKLEVEGIENLKGLDGILVPGGFGSRGIEGKILAARYARENNVPYFGICLGMQIATIEFARNVCNLGGATSFEFSSKGGSISGWDPKKSHLVIDLMESQKNLTALGGTMRLGLYNCNLKPGSKAATAYGAKKIKERHRHRFEFNDKYEKKLESCGMVFSGINPETKLVEIIELKNHPWFLAVQFHPEFKSRPTAPHPLFKDFIKAASK